MHDSPSQPESSDSESPDPDSAPADRFDSGRPLVQIEPQAVHEVIESNHGLFLVTFSFPGTQVYQTFRKELSSVAERFESWIRFGEVLVSAEPTLVQDFDLTSFPTLLLFQGADEVERVEQFWAPEPLTEYLETIQSFYS